MKTDKLQRMYKTIMLIVITAAITFIITSTVMCNNEGKQNLKNINLLRETSSYSTIARTFDNFKKFIEKNYIGEIDENKMLEYAIKGYVEGLDDDYSEYITAEEMKEYMESTNGKYVGVGIYISNNTQTNQIVVLMPMKGSPAEEAGIKSGDIITKIDGIPYKGEELSKASNALKKEEGTKVKVEVLRNEDELIEFEIERKNIKINHIESEVLENDIGYIQISTFDEGCYEEFEQAWNNLKSNNVKSLIIDLRNNGGGIVEEATNIADDFVNKGDILLIKTQKDKKEEITNAKKDKKIDIPIVILVNENTASSSEILTAAIKENYENATVVGKTTYGKGVIQTIFTLTDGSGLKLTTNEYFTPKHNSINKIGIKPDIEVELQKNESIYNIDKSKDNQLQKAIEILK